MKTGVTTAVFHTAGILPVCNEMLKIIDKGSAMKRDKARKRDEGSPSGESTKSNLALAIITKCSVYRTRNRLVRHFSIISDISAFMEIIVCLPLSVMRFESNM